jgi:hypothetical protein
MSDKWLNYNANAIKRGDFDISKIALNDDINNTVEMNSKLLWTLITRWLKSEKFI